MAAQKILVIDAPVFLAVDADADPEEVAGDFDSGFQVKVSDFNGMRPYNPEILNAGVREIRLATKEELDAVGMEIEGDDPE